MSKGPSSIEALYKYPHLRKNKACGGRFWQRGNFVDSVGVNEEIIRRYVRHQDKLEKQEEKRQLDLLG